MKIKQIFFIINGFAVSVMAILALVLFISITNLKEDTQWVTHTYDAIHEAEHLLINMIDQETGMRGFLATGNSEYLEPYESALAEFDANIELLKKKVNDNPTQVSRLVEIEMLSNQWHNQASDVYLAIKAEIMDSKDKNDELSTLTTSRVGKEKMDAVRELLEVIEDDSIRLNILNSMINMETGVRGYIINREESYLKPYHDGKRTLNEYVVFTDDQRIDDAVQDWIENIAEKEIQLVRETLNNKTDDDLYDALSLGTGKFIMDQIREEIEMFVHAEEELLVERNLASMKQYQVAITSIGVAFLMILVMGVIQRIATNKVTEPLIIFSHQMREFDPTDIDDEITFDKKAVSEVVDLALGYSRLLKQLKENLDEREKNMWIQKGQMEISSISESNADLESLLNHLISFFTTKLEGQYGAIYILDKTEKEHQYIFKAGFAVDNLEIMKSRYALGENMVGQVAIENEVLTLSNVPADHIKISTGLGRSNPHNIVIIPCAFNDEVIAIIEIASMSEFTDLMLDFVNKSKVNIGTAISISMTREKVRNLLDESKETNEKLLIQQEELRVSNEELETQSTMLMNTQSELEAQQENLKVVNDELKENAISLNEQKKILEDKNQELELSQMKIEEKTADLIQSNKYKSEFLANMSHELRTPLNSILILSDLLGESKELLDEELKYAETINSSGKSLLALINDILDLSKVEAGEMDMDIGSLNLVDFKSEMICLFEQISIRKNLRFSVNLSSQLPECIVTDSMKLKQIINNLLSNSFKFTESGAVDLNIRLKEDKIEFEVVDTGIGISEDKIHLIFGAFKQEDGTTSRKFGGTGLGLSISTEYAKMLGGILDVTSVKDKGSKFVLTLPMAIDHNELADMEIEDKDNNVFSVSADETEVVAETIENEYIPDDRKHIREDDKVILIVDDDPTFASIVVDICKSKDFKVIVAETGESGLYLADYYCPTGIILDIGLPGIDGWEVIDRLKKNKRTCDIPVNIVSGKDIGEKIASTGIQFYQKPISKSQIEKVLSKISSKGNKVNTIAIMGVSDVNQKSLDEFSTVDHMIKVVESSTESETLEIAKQQYIDLVVLNIDILSEEEVSFIKELKEKSVNKDLSIIVYTRDTITERDERNLRSEVDDIIINEGNSTQRLINEIKIFVHSVKENKLDSINNTLDSEKFLGKVVLVVDDDMRNIFALSSILQKMGIEVEMANDGQEALDMLESLERVDLVLMDIMMPVMDGYEAMNLIRAQKKYKDLPIIALTAKAMKGDKEICIKAGANEYLSKPLDKNKLLSILRVWI